MRKPRRDAPFADVRVEFGKRLKKHRVERKFTQDQVAKALEVTQPRVSEWERGAAFPSIPQVLRFCEHAGVGLERLFEGLARFDYGQLPLQGLEPDDRRALEHIVGKLVVIRGTANASTQRIGATSKIEPAERQ